LLENAEDMNDTLLFWCIPLGILSFVYFLRWIIPILLRYFLLPTNRDVPYRKPVVHSAPPTMPPELVKLYNEGLRNTTPEERAALYGSQLQNASGAALASAASIAGAMAAAAGFSL
jgi:hypothetical protein